MVIGALGVDGAGASEPLLARLAALEAMFTKGKGEGGGAGFGIGIAAAGGLEMGGAAGRERGQVAAVGKSL